MNISVWVSRIVFFNAVVVDNNETNNSHDPTLLLDVSNLLMYFLNGFHWETLSGRAYKMCDQAFGSSQYNPKQFNNNTNSLQNGDKIEMTPWKNFLTTFLKTGFVGLLLF